MKNPRAIQQDSIMPEYSWLVRDALDTSNTQSKVEAMRALGVPYTDADVDKALDNLKKQDKAIADDLAANGVNDTSGKEIIALIAYLQRLGTDIKGPKGAATAMR